MQIIRNNLTAFILAVVIHLAFVAVMVFSLDWDSMSEKPKVNIIQATVVDEKKVLAEIEKLKKAEKRKINKETQRKKKAEKDLKKIKNARKKEEKKRKVEQKRLAELKKKQAAEKKKAQSLAKKRKAEDKKIKQQQQVETKRLKELEIKRKAEEQRLAEAAMQRSMEDELKKEKAAAAKKKKANTARDIQAMTEIEKYISLIHQDVTSSWILPANFKPGSKCTVRVKLIPGGDVADVKVSKCSGDTLFDRSVDAAVRRASPLPVPKDPYVFDKMRDIEFIFNPKSK